MEDVFQKYINYLTAERNFSVYTVRNYTTDLIGSKNIKGYFRFLIDRGIRSLEEADHQMVREYLKYLADNDVKKTSISRKLSAIRSFYKYLNREEILLSNPVKGTSSPKLDRRLPEFCTVDEMRRLIEAPDSGDPFGKRDRSILELLYASGLRVSEIAGLDLDQVALSSHEIRILGKGSKERIVLIGEPAANALRTYLNEAREEIPKRKPAATKMNSSTSAVFVNKWGGRLTPRSIQILIQKYADLAQIGKKVHPHMVRHTFATHMLDGGADLRVVQELLGHANLSTTQIYTHISKKRAKQVYLSAHPMAQNDKGAENEHDEQD